MSRQSVNLVLMVVAALLIVSPYLRSNQNPSPDPPPSPVEPGERQLIVVWESSLPTIGITACLQSPKWDSYLASNNHHFWLIDQDSLDQSGEVVPAAFAPWISRAKPLGLPVLFINAADSSDGGADVLFEGPPPEIVDGWLELLKEHGG